MSVSSIAPMTVLALASGAFATVTPATLFGDSYIVKEGAGASARFYSVMDVYIKCGNSNDIISSTFGVSAYTSAYTMNQGDAFVQSNGDGTNNSWKPAAGTASWDSFVTCGNRDQASAAGFLQMQLDSNWAAGNGGAINNAASTGGAGWYPAVGASTSSNPYCRAGYYSGTGADNTAKVAAYNSAPGAANVLSQAQITANGIAAGSSLTNHWMIGRFAIDVTNLAYGTEKTMTLKFAIAGKQNGSTTFTGSTSAAGRFNYTLNFAVPAPGAAALVGIATLIGRRRRD